MDIQLKAKDGQSVKAGVCQIRTHGKTYIKKRYYHGPKYLFSAWIEVKDGLRNAA